MKLNIGAGKQTWPGYFCVDAVQHPKASRHLDMVHAFCFDGEVLTNPLPLEDGIADEVHNYHFIEHVYRWEAPALLGEFYRLLKKTGRLVIECPDIAKAAKNLLDGGKDQMCMWPLYGDPGHKDPYMCHRWGYTPATMVSLLHKCGYSNVTVEKPETHGKRANRDMRITAVK